MGGKKYVKRRRLKIYPAYSHSLCRIRVRLGRTILEGEVKVDQND